ncbi:hypothetical protein GJ496_004495, partial [Pomphorhynchus laevis]
MNIHLLFKLLLVRSILSNPPLRNAKLNFIGNQNGTITANDVENLLNSSSNSKYLTINISNASHIDTDVYRMLLERNIITIIIDLSTVRVDFSSLGNYLNASSIRILMLEGWTSEFDLHKFNFAGLRSRIIQIAVSDDNLNDTQKNPWALEHILIRNNYPQDRSLFDLISNWFDTFRSNQSTELALINNTVGLYIEITQVISVENTNVPSLSLISSPWDNPSVEFTCIVRFSIVLIFSHCFKIEGDRIVELAENRYFQFTNLINRTISASNCSYTIFAMKIQNVVNSKLEFKNIQRSNIELTFNNFNRSHLLIENITSVKLDIKIPNITVAQGSFKNFLNVEIIAWNRDLSFIKAIDNPAGITKLSILESTNYLNSIEFQRFTDLRYLIVANTEIDDNLTITLGNTNMTLILSDPSIPLIDKISNPSNVNKIQLWNGILSHPNFQNFTNLRQMIIANILIPNDSMIIIPYQKNLTLTLYGNNMALKDKISNPSNVYEIQLKNGILSHPNFQNFTNLRQMSFSKITIPNNSVIIMPDQENLTLTLYGNNMALKDKISNPSNVYEIQLKNGILSHPNFQNFTNLRQLSFSEIMIPNDSVIIMPDQENLTLTLYDNNIALKDKISNPSNVYEIQLKNGILSHPNFQNFTNLRQMSFSEIIIPSDSVIIMPDQENLTLRLSDLPDYSFELVKSINPKQFWEGNLYINGVKSNLSEIRNREDGNVADAT